MRRKTVPAAQVPTTDEITTEKNGNYTVISASREFSLFKTAKVIKDTVRELLSGGERRIAIDLSRAVVIDSEVISAIIECHKEVLRAGGEMALITSRNRVLEAMLKLRMDRVVRIIENEAALARLQSR
ncbi:MAG: STAS domain-containing protein [bacterium]